MQRVNSPSNQPTATTTSMRSSSNPQILPLSQLAHTSTSSEGSRFLPLPEYEPFFFEITPVQDCDWNIDPDIEQHLQYFNPTPNFCRTLQCLLAQNIKDDESHTQLYWCLNAILTEDNHSHLYPTAISYWAITQLQRHLIYAQGYAPTLLPYTSSACQPPPYTPSACQPPPYTPSECQSPFYSNNFL